MAGPYEEDPLGDPYTPNQPTGFEQFQPPPLIPEYTASDRLLEQRLRQGLSSVESDMADGILHPEHGGALREEIIQRLAPIQSKRMQAEQQAKAKARQDATEEMAFGQSVQQANMAHNAQGFASAIGHDPITGQRFAPPGWQQIDQPEQSYGGGETSDNYGPGAQTEWPEGEMGDTPNLMPDGSVNMTGYENPKTSVPLTIDPVVQRPNMAPSAPQSDGTQPMTIWNGAHRTEALYGPDKQLISQQTFAPNGQPMGRAASPPDDGRGRFFSQAAQMVGPAPQQWFRGVHGQQIPNPQYGAWQRAVSGQATRLLQEDIAVKKEQRVEDAKEIKAEITERGKMFHSRLDVLRGERNALLKDKTPKEEWPEELKSDTAIINEARKQVSDALGDWSPKLKEHYRKTGVWPKEGSASPPAASPAKPETPKQQLDTAKTIIKGLPSLTKPRPRSAENEINDPNP